MKKYCLLKKLNRIGIVSCALLSGIVAAGCAQKGEASLTEQGFEAVMAGEYDRARNLFESSVGENENIKEAYRGIGIAYLGAGEYEKAIEAFKDALSLSNGLIDDIDIDISYYMAVAQLRCGETAGAIDTYSAIIDIRPKEDNAYYMRGKALLYSGDKQKAMEDFEKTIELSPSDYDHYMRICEDLSAAGYEADGKSYIQKAMDGNSKLSDYQLGIFNYYLGNYTEARNYLENARNDSKSGADLVMYLGKTYEEIGDADYALTLYEGYISEGNPPQGAYLNIGMIKMHQQDYNGALEAFEAGLNQNDATYVQQLSYNRIVAYEYLRDFATAKNLMAEYIAKYPGDERAARENIFLSTR